MLKYIGREMTMRIAIILFVILFGSQMANAQSYNLFVIIDIKMIGKNGTVPSNVKQWGYGQAYYTEKKCEYDLMYDILTSDYVLEREKNTNKLVVNNYWGGSKDLIQQWRCIKISASTWK